MSRPARAPGLAFEAVRPPPDESPLRTDVAAFVGATHRGPVGVATRVDGWRGYVREFGDLDRDLDMPYAVRGYFDNGGQVAWIIRVADTATTSTATWDASGLAALPATLDVLAGSPGSWSAGMRVSITYRGRTTTGQATVDVSVRARDGETEEFRGVVASELVDRIAQQSRLIRFVPTSLAPSVAPARSFAVISLVLGGGSGNVPSAAGYIDAIDRLDDVPEVALVAMPDVHDYVDDAAVMFAMAMARAEMLRDRLVLVDLPSRAPGTRWHADGIEAWIDGSLGRLDQDLGGDRRWRAAALYHPHVVVTDPLGGDSRPTRVIAPSGHVAGVISQLDRDRGAWSTPANAPLLGIVDLDEDYDNDEHARLNQDGVDLLRCIPALGYSVWGGRTLDRTDDNRFVAHRRLIHRLVRAIRRVAEPLVFETNGPVLWFAFVRAITAVLLEAWRAGSLAGTRPDEAFEVVCDDTTNPPEQIDLGQCVCSISVAPAVPMEFILVRVALSRDGTLEVLA